MKSFLLFFVALFCINLATGQKIKDGFGKSITTGDQTLKVVADPSKRPPGWTWGFQVDFEFTLGRGIDRTWDYYVQVEKIDIRKDLGYYHKYYSEKNGTYFPCAQLKSLCDNAAVNEITINATWEYNGQQFKTGAMNFSSYKGKGYLQSNMAIQLPGGDVIPFEAAKSGAAKVVKIEVASWSVSDEQAIMDIVREKKRK